jgi:hypothetical protein
MFNAPRNEVKGNPQQAAVNQELQFLRGRIASLEKQLRNAPAPTTAEQTKGPVVEKQVDASKLELRSKTALRNLLVAVENYFGPVEGKPTPKMGGELTEAVKEAEKIIRPNRTEKKAS